jgi:hypothetical protein
MTYEAPLPDAPIYRLVVTASQLKAKQFVWVIVDDTHGGRPVQTSKVTFRSMEDAYNAGKGALEYWRQGALFRRWILDNHLRPSHQRKRGEVLEKG